jgi:4-amino-4-deoxy-L-arabinose transferase-like glycosyltransferase
MHIPLHMRSLSPIAVAIGATLCALAFSLVLFPLISGPLTAHVDPDKFGELGDNIARGRGFLYGTGDTTVTAFDRAPLYPLIVAFFRGALGDRFATGLQVLQALLHGLTGLVVYRIGKETFDHRTALFAQIIHGIHPVMLWYTARVWIETTNTLLTTLVVLMVILLQNEAPARRAVLAGVVIAAAVLTKSVILSLPLLFMASALLRKRWHTARSLAIATAVAVVIIAPWMVRNHVESGRIVPVHTSLGLNLMQGEAIAEHWGEAPFSTLALWQKGESDTREVLAGSSVAPSSPEGDARLIRHVAGTWSDSPARFLRHVAVNALTYWYLSESPLKSAVILFLQLPLIFFAVRGMCHAREHREFVLLLVLAVLYFWGVHAVIVGWMRYSVPAIPILILLAVRGVRGTLPHTPAPYVLP